jgi:hypothetical protein
MQYEDLEELKKSCKGRYDEEEEKEEHGEHIIT